MTKKFTQIAALCMLIIGLVHLSSCQTPNTPPVITGENGTDSSYNESMSETSGATEPGSTATETLEDNDGAETLPGYSIPNHVSYSPSYQVFEYGSDTLFFREIQIDHDDEIDMSLVKDETSKPESETRICQIGESTIHATYSYRVQSPYYHDSVLAYTAKAEDGSKILIEYSQDSGKLMRYVPGGHYEHTEENALTEEECIARAKQILMELNENGDLFQLITSSPQENYYIFTFYRFIGQLRTNEYVIIFINKNGDLRAYMGQMLGSMDGIVVPDYDEQEIRKAIEFKLSEIYQPVLEKYSCMYVIDDDDVYLTRLRNGKLYLDYTIHVYGDFTEGTRYLDGVRLLICIQ
jgi:hypothetical protein